MKSCSNAYAVIGLGFGDEGKGMQVHSLCQRHEDSMVIRFSGGQQAAHTVYLNKTDKHIFSNFGSGTLVEAPTYWSKYCTVDPVGIINEFDHMCEKSDEIKPKLFIDKKCPVTTPYDKFHNQRQDKKNGTCGAGVGSTWQREEDHYSLLAGDLLFDSILKTKLEMISTYYDLSCTGRENRFLECCDFVRSRFDIVDKIPVHKNYIFEGSQGLLLDQDIGFFPHVTRSNVGSKNILEMGCEPYVYLMTRAFQTRHGYGPMTNTEIPHKIKDNPFETNTTNKFQGEFRKSLLDLDLLKYGLSKDEYLKTTNNKELVVTCMDLMEDNWRYTINGRVMEHINKTNFIKGISEYLNIDVGIRSSPY